MLIHKLVRFCIINPQIQAKSNWLAVLYFTIGIFITVTILNLGCINIPPVWDAAAGVFAPAIDLYLSGYDVSALIDKAGYYDAEPNTYSFNLITQFTYAAIALSQGNPSLYVPFLHIMQFAFASFGILAVYILAKSHLDNLLSLLCCLWLLLFPLFSVQVSYLYTELPGMVFLLWAIITWADRRFVWMLTFIMLAYLVKSFAIIAVAFFTLTMFFDARLSTRRKLLLIGFLCLIPIVIESLTHVLATRISASEFVRTWPEYMTKVFSYLIAVPDLLLLILINIVVVLVFLINKRNNLMFISTLVSSEHENRAWFAIYTLPLFFYGFIVTINFVYPSFIPLVRYYTWVLPFLILGLVRVGYHAIRYGIKNKYNRLRYIKRYALPVILIGIAFTSCINRDGFLYPDNISYNKFSYVERSFEYLKYYKLQKKMIELANQYGKDMPVFFTRGVYYMASSRLMGYVDTVDFLPKYILKKPYDSADLSFYPEDFLLVDANSNSFHGQGVVKNIIKSAKNNPNYNISLIAEYVDNPYHGKLYCVNHIH